MAATTHLVLWMLFVVTVIPLTNGLPVDLIVDTTQGKLQGFELDESYAFWGIPFAQPPVGNLRLRDPQPPVSWEDVRNATEHSDGCMQRCHEPPPACPVNWSEDCLYLDVWIPKTGRNDYPVLVFMHGGAFRDGSGGALLYDSRFLSKESDAIIITINYRMEAFGFVFLGNVFDPATQRKRTL
ncbi:putative crystal protein-like [Apostichopus japonicus]|uniref:Putative crystal protein-like n=1 Tax=Stichopus japonicus TaxID=307972 RepID=A0A2G8LFS5_STIJA|nr:putative crystal protein-like [Apostichopus japonicus]